MKQQSTQHSKENLFITYLSRKLGNRFQKASVEDDINNGIDCYIDGKPYDLKATKGNILTVFKFNPTGKPNKWYSPLTLHPDIPYLLPTNDPNKLRIYTKTSIMYYFRTNPNTGIYSGDGNINITVDISGLEYEEFILDNSIGVFGKVSEFVKKDFPKPPKEEKSYYEQIIDMFDLDNKVKQQYGTEEVW